MGRRTQGREAGGPRRRPQGRDHVVIVGDLIHHGGYVVFEVEVRDFGARQREDIVRDCQQVVKLRQDAGFARCAAELRGEFQEGFRRNRGYSIL